MISGIQHRLIDYAGLLQTVSQDQFNALKADNDDFAQADFDLKARKIMEAGIEHYGIVPAKAGAILIRADITEASKAWDELYGGQGYTAAIRHDAKILPFVRSEAKPVSGLHAAFDEAAAPVRPMARHFARAALMTP